MFKSYLSIIKPGIIVGNLFSVICGFFLASQKNINYLYLLKIIISTSLIIGSSCVFNNIIDCDIDRIMKRTNNRVFPKNIISLKKGFIYAFILGINGFLLSFFWMNYLTTFIAFLGFIIYVLFYTAFFKKNSIHSTLIGSLSGATPPVIGYCSVSNQLDLCSMILFFMFFFWQIPHTYTIAISRFKDYKKVNIPLLPIKKGITITKKYIIFYIFLFTIFNVLLSINGYTSYIFLVVSIILNTLWIAISLYGFKKDVNNHLWAKKNFLFSIFIITMISVIIIFDSL
ncbi:heme o synthase [Candidatus Tachikawaea gelatinosa]|uniref:Protoheme IX farnesyltransferase n=1 Tax=Candidatus Tachikawaea gelatinosa TaxID=1410383 RepID=A0A090BWL6_9ENTR|nr:heme o synthase [Candidatus Tachikawaea gelatinosa]BAP58821.1 protoheme IX farnesyltransferase [Candidatus Tachikawaea gelatinosa]